MENKLNGWDRWGQHILTEVKRFNDFAIDVLKEVSEMKKDVAVLKTELKIKSGIWGLLGGLIPAIGVFLYLILK